MSKKFFILDRIDTTSYIYNELGALTKEEEKLLNTLKFNYQILKALELGFVVHAVINTAYCNEKIIFMKDNVMTVKAPKGGY
jgi:hypothetical protein